MIDALLPIVGTKVLIRKLNEKDLESLYALEIDDDVKRYVGGPVTRPQQEWIEGMTGLCSTPYAVLPLIVKYKPPEILLVGHRSRSQQVFVASSSAQRPSPRSPPSKDAFR
jgi:hypothetical protein